MKRFTETNKWDDPWFRKLSPTAKLLWSYMTDKCDPCGVIDLDLETASFHIGSSASHKHLSEIESRTVSLPSGKLWIRRFVQFQYGKLSRDCKPHVPVFDALKRNGIPVESVEQNDSFSNVVDSYLREAVIKRDGPVCVYSGKQLQPWEIEIDHIIPRSKGGVARMENLVVMDKELNALKGQNDVKTFCALANLDYERVSGSLSKAIGKNTKGIERVQEKEKEKEKDKKGIKTGKGTGDESETYSVESRVLLRLLNEQTGKRFRESNESLEPINARLKEPEVDLEGCRKMVTRQVQLWKGTRLEEYLRPSTLFGKEKFNEYYASRESPIPSEVNGHAYAGRVATSKPDHSKGF